MTGPTAAQADVSTPPSPRSGLLLFAAAALAAGWWIFLCGLAAFTANPVLLNREQILHASYVVTGTLSSDPATPEVFIERVWKGNALKGPLLVSDLAAVARRPGKTYIFPLSRMENGFHVTKVPFHTPGPPIYPATPDAIKQLQAILSRQNRG